MKPRDAALTPEKPGVTPPTAAQLRASLDSVIGAVTPWADTTVNRPLLERIRRCNDRVAPRIPELGITVVKFANGVEAWLKPTDFKNDQILFSMYAMGGASLAPPADYFQAAMATRYISLSGYGGLSAVDLQKVMTGKRIGVSPSIGLSSHAIGGSAAPSDFESALQLLYQEFTAPGDDAEARSTRLAAGSIAPSRTVARRRDRCSGRSWTRSGSSNHYASLPLTADVAASIDPADARVLQGAVRQRRRLHDVRGRGVSVDFLAAARAPSAPAVNRHESSQWKTRRVEVPDRGRARTVSKGLERVRQSPRLLCGCVAGCARAGEAQAATFALETAARRSERTGPDHGVGRLVAVALPGRQPQRNQLQRRPAEHRRGRSRHAGIRRLRDRGRPPCSWTRRKRPPYHLRSVDAENGYWMGACSASTCSAATRRKS
jgi:hypothetical protein